MELHVGESQGKGKMVSVRVFEKRSEDPVYIEIASGPTAVVFSFSSFFSVKWFLLLLFLIVVSRSYFYQVGFHY